MKFHQILFVIIAATTFSAHALEGVRIFHKPAQILKENQATHYIPADFVFVRENRITIVSVDVTIPEGKPDYSKVTKSTLELNRINADSYKINRITSPCSQIAQMSLGGSVLSLSMTENQLVMSVAGSVEVYATATLEQAQIAQMLEKLPGDYCL